MVRLLARVARWSLPAALLAATLVAAAGLSGLLFSQSPASPPAPVVALNLSSAPALPAADDGAELTPQQAPGAVPTPCPNVPRPACPRPAGHANQQTGCCR